MQKCAGLKWTDRIVKIFVTFFGLGLIPFAPGTWGTVGAIPLVWLFTMAGPYGYMFLTLMLCFAAVFASEVYERRVASHDNSEIVIDEVVGFLVTMTWLPLTWQSVVLGFVLFRLLDIFKPLFIGTLDRKIKGGLGVVTDDLAAGLVANIILQIAFTYSGLLGRQLAP
jgi:phosphatidylglycerophosphatase A